MLRKTDQSLAEIADACGFFDQSYFTRVFQDVMGVAPEPFRACLALAKRNATDTKPCPMTTGIRLSDARRSQRLFVRAGGI